MMGSIKIPSARPPAQLENECVARTTAVKTKIPTKIDGMPVITSAKNRTVGASGPRAPYSLR